MAECIDMVNKKCGYLTIISKVENTKTGARWLCKCDCGAETIVRGYDLRKGTVVSCGCYRKQAAINAITTHGMSKTRLFHEWQYIKRRCYNKNYKYYSYYGGKGISVCSEWLNSFECFHNWAINNGYTDELTLDRIDSNGNYEPSNCRWITRKEQQNNTSRNHRFTINGETKTLAQWCEIYNVPHERTRYRVINKHWDILTALTTPPLK